MENNIFLSHPLVEAGGLRTH